MSVGRGPHRAYLLALLQPDGTYALDVCSEEHPTIMGPRATAVVAEGRGGTYEEARSDLAAWMRSFLAPEIAGRIVPQGRDPRALHRPEPLRDPRLDRADAERRRLPPPRPTGFQGIPGA